MKLLQILVLSFCFYAASAQNIFEYEQKIKPSTSIEATEINFTNSNDNLELSGTLLYPKAGYDKIVMIVPGSGKDTRHSHFVLAENFLKNNIAVYRFDERGIGESEGKYDYTATTLRNDLIFAHQKLRSLSEYSDKKIGVLGHSLGSIASIGAYGQGCAFNFLIQIGAPVQKGGAFLQYQALKNSDGFYTVEGKTTEEVISFIDRVSKMVVVTDDYKTIKKNGKRIMKEMGFKKGLYIIVNPLQVDLIKQDHELTYKECPVPLLYIIGSEDRIVSCDNEAAVLQELNNPNVTIKIIDNTNHWLNDEIGPTKMERSLYQMNDGAINEIVNWTLNN